MSDDFNHDEVFKVALIIGAIVFIPSVVGLMLLVQ